MPETHAKFSPSAAPRWLRCPGSIALSEHAPPDEGSEYAREGTAAHELAEKMLRERVAGTVEEENDTGHALYALMAELESIYDVEEMEGHVDRYVDEVTRRAFGGAGELHIEERLDYSEAIGVPEQYGTGDAVIVFDDCIEVHDLKYGRGKQVRAKENEQLMCYALGALAAFDLLGTIRKVRIVIHQVRRAPADEWEVSVEQLREFETLIRAAAKNALSEDPVFCAGEIQCQWCPAKGICTHAAQHAGEITTSAQPAEFEDLDAGALVQAMDVAQFEAYYEKVGFVEEWAAAMHKRAMAEALNGTLTKYKAAQGRPGNRKWANQKEAETVLKSMRLKKEEMYNHALISPTAAEKLLKKSPKRWARLENLIERPEGKVKVVPIDDASPAITNTAEPTEFDNLNAGDDLV